MSQSQPPEKTRTHPPAPASIDLAPTLTLLAVLDPEAATGVPEGTHAYLGRVVGVARRLVALQGQAGPILRLQGEFLAFRPLAAGERHGGTYAARSLLVPEVLADEVRAVFLEHPKRSARDRVRVHFEFDVWAIPEARAALGYRLQLDGRAWVPEPFSALVASALARPLPTAPESR